MDSLPKPIRDSIAFEQSNYVDGSVIDEPFYSTPKEAETAAPGSLLRVESDVDNSKYLIPPGIALSRIIYQSENLNGQVVPVSALILWPYTASKLADGYPVVAWAHGTSGGSPDCAPSHLKNVWQHFLAPYQLVLQGYVVVATDYAGMGVGKTNSGATIVHEYLAFPSHANDIVYGVGAAQQAFEELSKCFVVIGQSQGGGAAWACAQRQATKPINGYLGAIAISPPTKVLNETGPFGPLLGVAICPTVAASDPGFDMAAVLTESGLQYWETVKQLGAGMATAALLYLGSVQAGTELLKPHWKENEHLRKFQDLTHNGGKAIGGPLLVIHGDEDDRVSGAVVSKAVEETARLYPSSQLTYLTLPAVTHAPALLAAQKIWMDWIGSRFGQVNGEAGHEQRKVVPIRDPASYHKEQNWYLETATEFYHAP